LTVETILHRIATAGERRGRVGVTRGISAAPEFKGVLHAAFLVREPIVDGAENEIVAIVGFEFERDVQTLAPALHIIMEKRFFRRKEKIGARGTGRTGFIPRIAAGATLGNVM